MFLDICFLIVLLYYAFKGYSKGFIITFITSIAKFVGIIVAIVFSATVTKLLFSSVATDNVLMLRLIPILSYLLVFFVAVFLVKILAQFMKGVITKIGIGFLDKLAGALVSILFIAIATSVLYWMLEQLGILSATIQQSSISFGLLKNWAPAIFVFIQKIFPFLQTTFADFKLYLEGLNTSLESYVGFNR
jgi:membrane protein required for colicin V production